jgi:hypothetical protein
VTETDDGEPRRRGRTARERLVAAEPAEESA